MQVATLAAQHAIDIDARALIEANPAEDDNSAEELESQGALQ
jgi:hypothetical protein